MTAGHGPHTWPSKHLVTFFSAGTVAWRISLLKVTEGGSKRGRKRAQMLLIQSCVSTIRSCFLSRQMNPHKNLGSQMTFKYYQHCKIWLGLIYLLWLSSWVLGGTPVSIYILTWAFVLVKADNLTAMTSHTKAWISDELPTNPWPELCWMHIEGDKLIWPVAVPTRGLALCWALLLEVVYRWASNHCPYPKAWK